MSVSREEWQTFAALLLMLALSGGLMLYILWRAKPKPKPPKLVPGKTWLRNWTQAAMRRDYEGMHRLTRGTDIDAGEMYR